MNVDKFISEIERTFNIPESGIILEDFRPSLNLIRIMKVLVSDEDPSNSVFQVLKFWEPCDIEAMDDDDASAILELQNIIDDMEKNRETASGTYTQKVLGNSVHPRTDNDDPRSNKPLFGSKERYSL